MMSFERAEKYRTPHPLGLPHKKGDPFGWFLIPTKFGQGPAIRVMAAPSDAEWQHVSVSLGDRCPTWKEMCKIKAMFWGPEDVVVQFHPAESEYVNNAQYCLHLWSWKGGRFPTPDPILVGIR